MTKPWEPLAAGEHYWTLCVANVWGKDKAMVGLAADRKGPHLRAGGQHIVFWDDEGNRHSKVIRAITKLVPTENQSEVALEVVKLNIGALLDISGSPDAVKRMHTFLASLGSQVRRIGQARGLNPPKTYRDRTTQKLNNYTGRNGARSPNQFT